MEKDSLKQRPGGAQHAFGIAGLFFLSIHLFVVWYEEPTLRRLFGHDYEAYKRRVRRWWPRP